MAPTPQDLASLNALLMAAKPFLRITDVDAVDWCRSIADPKDARNGPWRYRAVYDVLDDKVWSTVGEVIYFVTDSRGNLRLVGQSKDKLKTRWRTSPMHDVTTKMPLGRHALFHSSTWPAIESALDAGERPPFTVSALFRNELERVCRSCEGSITSAWQKEENHLQRLSYHVETWVCSQPVHRPALWNKQKYERKGSGKVFSA